MKYIQYNSRTVFHVHTFRCGHAEMTEDEEYIKRSIELGAEDIWFTDHIPFPGDEINSRMKMNDLPEYTDTLKRLKKKYEGIINVHTGLEAEYIPSFCDYYKKIVSDPDIELLMLGQHLFEMSDGRYNYTLPEDEWHSTEMEGCGNAMIEAFRTGLFSVCAHPDRIFRYRGSWDDEMDMLAKKIISAAAENNIILEKNMSSLVKQNCFRPEFWALVPEDYPVIKGLDAHMVSQLDRFNDVWNDH